MLFSCLSCLGFLCLILADAGLFAALADRAKLRRVCCAPQELVVPEGAPRPAPINSRITS